MTRNFVEQIVNIVAKKKDLPPGWDKYAPVYYRIEVEQSLEVIIALASDAYVVSLTDGNRVESTIARDGSTESVHLLCGRWFASGTSARDFATPLEDVASKRHMRAEGLRDRPAGPPQPSHESSEQFLPRNPLAPPGFEDEFQMGQPGVPEIPNPLDIGTNDLYPTGQHPSLSPNMPLSGPMGGGMHPPPFGSSRQPHMRWDPPGPGGAPGSGGPFGNNHFI